MYYSFSKICTSALLIITSYQFGAAQTDIRELKLKDWQPRSMMVTKETRVEKPAFPVIDIHNHLGGGKGWLTPDRVNRYLAEMDAAGGWSGGGPDGGWGSGREGTTPPPGQAPPRPVYTLAHVDFCN